MRITPGPGARAGKLRKPYAMKTGYLTTTLRIAGKSYGFLIHRLVAQNFIPNPENKPEVNHRDGNKAHNHAGNLEWVTRAEHIRHTVAMGLVKGERNGGSKLTEEHVHEIRRKLNSGMTHGRIANIFGVCRETISEIHQGSTWSWL